MKIRTTWSPVDAWMNVERGQDNYACAFLYGWVCVSRRPLKNSLNSGFPVITHIFIMKRQLRNFNKRYQYICSIYVSVALLMRISIKVIRSTSTQPWYIALHERHNNGWQKRQINKACFKLPFALLYLLSSFCIWIFISEFTCIVKAPRKCFDAYMHPSLMI